MRCREITPEDFGDVAKLLCEGFPRRSEKYWRDGLLHLESLPTCDGFTRYGYKLEDGSDLVGALLVLTSNVVAGKELPRRNVSSWYVRPQYRLYGTLLSRVAMAKPATYIDIDPDPSTWKAIEALGFRKFAKGALVCFPALTFKFKNIKVKSYKTEDKSGIILSESEKKIFDDHVKFGCIGVYVEVEAGIVPFIFRERRLRWFLPPCVELIYCRNIDSFVELSASIGRYFALRGIFWVLLGANGPVSGLIGFYFAGKLTRYYKGELPPPLGDLSYTEVAIFGA